MKELELNKAFTLMEPGPVTMITTSDKGKDNIMTLSWHIVLGFEGRLAIMTGPWNYSYTALIKNKECVINIPCEDLIEKAIGVGTTTGSETDKFKKFKLTPVKSHLVNPPSIKECIAGIECRVIDEVKEYDLIILETVYAWTNNGYGESKSFHYSGDGIFIVDGRHLDYKREMSTRLP